MVLLPGCQCCSLCFPFPIDESVSVEVDLSASGFGSYSAVLEAINIPSISRDISASSSSAAAGTYSMQLNGSYSGIWGSVSSFAQVVNTEWLINQLVSVSHLVTLQASSPYATTTKTTFHAAVVTRNCFRTGSVTNRIQGAFTQNPWYLNSLSIGAETGFYYGNRGTTLSSAANCNLPFSVTNGFRITYDNTFWRIRSSSFPVAETWTATEAGAHYSNVGSVGFDVTVSISQVRIIRGAESMIWYTDAVACE